MQRNVVVFDKILIQRAYYVIMTSYGTSDMLAVFYGSHIHMRR